VSARFKVGQKVRSLIDAQGLERGAVYEVIDVREQVMFFGTFVTYLVKDKQSAAHVVTNGHLVLEAVEVES
jgi:hypothetical protein